MSLARDLDKVGALVKVRLFAGLPEEVLRKLADRSKVRRLSRGEMLYSEHETAAGLFVVVAGELRSIRQNAVGREQVLSTEGPGATLAEVPVFSGGNYFTTVIADAPSTVLVIDHKDVHRTCEEHPELLWNVTRVLADQVRHCAELIESLALRNVDQRLARYLLTMAEDRGIRFGEGLIFELTQTRAQIAARVGSVREVISRSLSHLHETRLVVLHGKNLVAVPNVQALREFAGEALPSASATSLALP